MSAPVGLGALARASPPAEFSTDGFSGVKSLCDFTKSSLFLDP